MIFFGYSSQGLLLLGFCSICFIPSSVLIPVPGSQHRIKLSIEQEPVYISPEDLEGIEESGGSQDVYPGLEGKSDQEMSAINAETSETLRKINPLTIADQVSNLLRKGNEEPSTSANQQPPMSIQSLQNLPRNIQNNDILPSGDPKDVLVRNSVMNDESFLRAIQKNNPSVISSPQRSAARVDSPESAKGSDQSPGKPGEVPEGYIRQETPKIVNKPRPRDNPGYSVIVMAGDAVKFPIKINSKPSKSKENQESEVKEDCSSVLGQLESGPSGNLRRGDAENRKPLREKNTKKEFRVSKHYGKYPDFPVYDEDFNFVPDPLQGVLDENYWKEVDKNGVQKLAVPMESYKIGEFGFEPHNILMRSNDDNGEYIKGNEGIQACGGGGGGWRKKSNSSEIVTD